MKESFALVLSALALSAASFAFIAARTGGAAEDVPASERTSKSQTGQDNMTHKQDKKENKTMETATFAAGCFWGVEADFRKVDGVVDAAVGYTGGHTSNPSYKQVCSGKTGHAEAVQVTYDPEKVSYDKLLDIFWASHDPTQLNRQGPDVGTQYRSAIFTHTPEQKAAAEASRKRLAESGALGGRQVTTEIAEAGPFYRAEEYHQRYLEKRGIAVCH